jgi:hypothetical protein
MSILNEWRRLKESPEMYWENEPVKRIGMKQKGLQTEIPDLENLVSRTHLAR